ncbi:DUF1996 domain-containing protein [Streptomyces sp. PR69]|uniref:DUF1996 domain-containing protein n=1 Tax=Streptomyces sp. PR69 TaxID=2984950 RepID=UPI00226487E4|nr:DUF1996 domain-containing protein [Streptomyces sp. PR69]
MGSGDSGTEPRGAWGAGGGPRRRVRPWRLALAVAVCALLAAGLTAAVVKAGDGRRAAGAVQGPSAGDFTELRDMPAAPPPPAAGPDASTGVVTVRCGRNEEGHYNEDNVVIAPGVRGSAHHTHTHVGNLSTSAFSTDESLASAPTSCAGGDRSAYYWPVLRRQDQAAVHPYEKAAGHGNAGRILLPATARIEFHGSPVSDVVAMPRFLRAVTGDAVAHTRGDDSLVRARWGCSSAPDRAATRYPRCPEGDRVTRTLTFPSCWNGLDTDSAGHRAHLVHPAGNGVCPTGAFPVPQLRIALSYDVPAGAPIAVDSFPEQLHDPRTDHAMFINVMTERQMNRVVDCLNSGRRC